MFSDKAYDLRQEGNAEEINEDEARKELSNFLELLIMFKPEMYTKIKSVGDACVVVGKALGIKEVQFYLAGYYSNFGLLSVESYATKHTKLAEDERDLLHMHTITSMEFMKLKKFHIASELAYYHHEYPDKSGFLSTQNIRYKESYIIHIIDSFIEYISRKQYRPSYSRRMAIEKSTKPYENYPTMITPEDLTIIKDTLMIIEHKEIGTII